jgi:transposase
MVNIQDLFDDAKCYQTIRAMRWPDGVTFQRCSSGSVIRNGRDETQPDENVRQATIGPLIERTIAKGTLIYTDEYDDYSRLAEWGYGHETVCHAAGEYARDDDGDGFCEVHVNTLEGFWSLLRSWLRPHRGIPQESLPLYLGFFEFVHNVRA